MADTYKGESSAKRLMRFWVWDHILRNEAAACRVAAEQSLSVTPLRKFIVLASREGGDVSVLRGLGIPEEQILAAEIEPAAADAFARRWPNVELHRGDVVDLIAKRAQEIDIILLDLCGKLGEKTITTIQRAFVKAPPICIFGVCVLRGMEDDVELPLSIRRGNRADRRRMQAAHRHGGVLVAKVGYRSCGKKVTFTSTSTLDDSGGNSMNTLTEVRLHQAELARQRKEDFSKWSWMADRRREIEREDRQTDKSRHRSINRILYETIDTHVSSFFSVNYQSDTLEGQGVPMTYSFHVKGSEVYQDDEEETRFFHLRWANHDLAEKKMRQMVAAEPERPWELLFNLPRSTIAAWRAHVARGTYLRIAEREGHEELLAAQARVRKKVRARRGTLVTLSENFFILDNRRSSDADPREAD